jgi:hypothetical protein
MTSGVVSRKRRGERRWETCVIGSAHWNRSQQNGPFDRNEARDGANVVLSRTLDAPEQPKRGFCPGRTFGPLHALRYDLRGPKMTRKRADDDLHRQHEDGEWS